MGESTAQLKASQNLKTPASEPEPSVEKTAGAEPGMKMNESGRVFFKGSIDG